VRGEQETVRVRFPPPKEEKEHRCQPQCITGVLAGTGTLDAVNKAQLDVVSGSLDTLTGSVNDNAGAITDLQLTDAAHEQHMGDLENAFNDALGGLSGSLAPVAAASHTHANKTTLDKIGESSGAPTWSGSAWPGAGFPLTGESVEFISFGTDGWFSTYQKGNETLIASAEGWQFYIPVIVQGGTAVGDYELKTALAGKQDVLAAGPGISIAGGTISATAGGGSGGGGFPLLGTGVSLANSEIGVMALSATTEYYNSKLELGYGLRLTGVDKGQGFGGTLDVGPSTGYMSMYQCLVGLQDGYTTIVGIDGVHIGTSAGWDSGLLFATSGNRATLSGYDPSFNYVTGTIAYLSDITGGGGGGGFPISGSYSSISEHYDSDEYVTLTFSSSASVNNTVSSIVINDIGFRGDANNIHLSSGHLYFSSTNGSQQFYTPADGGSGFWFNNGPVIVNGGGGVGKTNDPYEGAFVFGETSQGNAVGLSAYGQAMLWDGGRLQFQVSPAFQDYNRLVRRPSFLIQFLI
jgi:hypothetical protein